MEAKSARIFIFDPCFGRMTGHWENYCKRFYRELVNLGHPVVVYGQTNPSENIVKGVTFRPLFEHLPFVEMHSFIAFEAQAKLFLTDLKNLNVKEFRDSDILIFHSIFPQILFAIAKWTQLLIQQVNVKVALFFQFPPAEAKQHSNILKRFYYTIKHVVERRPVIKDLDWFENKTVKYYQHSAKILAPLVANKSHFLFTSTDILARNFSAMLNITVHNLPMPGPIYPKSFFENTVMLDAGNELPLISFGYFGHSSLEKGGQYLEYLVKKIPQIYDKTKFILHINPNKDTESYLKCFENNSNKNIYCHYGHLEQEAMLNMMQQVDVILIPYAPNKYATTPSAIFTESMPLQKIFILPKHTWMHHEAEKYQAGYVAFEKYNQSSILNSIVTAIINFKLLQAKSIVASKNFYMHNNIENYTRMFSEIISLNG